MIQEIFRTPQEKEYIGDDPQDIYQAYTNYYNHILTSPITEQHFQSELASIFLNPIEKHKGSVQNFVDDIDRKFAIYSPMFWQLLMGQWLLPSSTLSPIIKI